MDEYIYEHPMKIWKEDIHTIVRKMISMILTKLKKIYYYTKFGGVKLLIMRVIDKAFGTRRVKEFIYYKSSKADPGEYEYLLSLIYGMRTGKKLNIHNPISFNEKIQWLKLYDTTPLKTQLADKYKVREWIVNKIGEKYLIPLLGVWDKFEDIDLDKLPDSFVLKATHGSGMNVIVSDKKKHDWKKTKQKFDFWMTQNFAFVSGFELQYKDIESKIIAEQYIKTNTGTLYDYKIHCFNGVPIYIEMIGDRNYERHTAKEAFYNTDWELLPFSTTYPSYETTRPKPVKLEEMLCLARIMSEGFSYVRVDLYELDDGVLKFGEMTFTPSAGMECWLPEEVDLIVGEKINLPE